MVMSMSAIAIAMAIGCVCYAIAIPSAFAPALPQLIYVLIFFNFLALLVYALMVPVPIFFCKELVQMGKQVVYLLTPLMRITLRLSVGKGPLRHA